MQPARYFDRLRDEDGLDNRHTERKEPLLGLLGTEAASNSDCQPEGDSNHAEGQTVADVDAPPGQHALLLFHLRNGGSWLKSKHSKNFDLCGICINLKLENIFLLLGPLSFRPFRSE